MPIHMNRALRPPGRQPRDRTGVRVIGMGGMGDNLHQRALVRELMRTQIVYLETPWPSIYHDLVGDRLKLSPLRTPLRTQTKNLRREHDRYSGVAAPTTVREMSVWYSPDDVRKEGSVLAAMLKSTHCTETDFSLPVPLDWQQQLSRLLPFDTPSKPIMVYRPLVSRTEWGGCAARNPDYDAYYELFNSIRDRFFVVSVADLEEGKEWVVGKQPWCDVEFNHGELTFEMLAALMKRASLSFASPGFATILAQAVGTPSVCVFGGYENSTSFSGGMALAPYLGIDPIHPCSCFQHHHPCRKAIDVPRAASLLQAFAAAKAKPHPLEDGGADDRQLGLPFETVHEPGGARDADLAG